jgi:glutamine---fructose-6-phosphate transaminase (isomerizing)
MLGVKFEREIYEQPDIWRRIAESDKAAVLAGEIRDRDLVFIGTGSSLFAAQLGALAFRRRGINAHALAATESVLDNVAYQHAVVIAISRSGESEDLLQALDIVEPKKLIALTNTPDSTLAKRADVWIDAGAGPEVAIPSSKSTTATVAILLWAAGIVAGKSERNADSLSDAAEDVRAWLEGDGVEAVRQAALRIARRRSVIIASTGYGLPVAHELALKLKEASYIHAEGFSAGELQHGSAAMLDAGCAIIGIADDSSRHIVSKPLAEADEAECLRYVIGQRIADVPLLGPVIGVPFNTLAWLVAGQAIALYVGRARYVESDAPRGLVRFLR